MQGLLGHEDGELVARAGVGALFDLGASVEVWVWIFSRFLLMSVGLMVLYRQLLIEKLYGLLRRKAKPPSFGRDLHSIAG